MDSELKNGYTRSKVLKRAGVGAAALFGAPVLVSTAVAATDALGKRCVTLALKGAPSATGLGPCDFGDSGGRPCPCHMGGFVGPVCDTGDTGACFCFVDVKGCANCVDVTQVGCDAPTCTKTSQCPAGWKCVYTCCDACPNGVGCCDTCTGGSAPSSGPSGAGLRCLPPCTVASKASGVGAAARALAKAGG